MGGERALRARSRAVAGALARQRRWADRFRLSPRYVAVWPDIIGARHLYCCVAKAFPADEVSPRRCVRGAHTPIHAASWHPKATALYPSLPNRRKHP